MSVRSRNGGEAHIRNRLAQDPFPACRTGAQTRTSTRYVESNGAVTCARCLDKIAAAELRAYEEAAALEGARAAAARLDGNRENFLMSQHDRHGIVAVALTRAHRDALRQAIGEVQAGAMETWAVDQAEALSDAFDALWAAEDV